jgi:peptidoglycan hydrolase-like protein with peptidoglycan-binding domain
MAVVGSGVRLRRGCASLIAVVAVLALSACGGDSRSDVEKAQAKVTSKQKAVTEAQTAFDHASQSFCTKSKTYVEAIDRYGNILTQSAVTVGDVKTAGADLAKPKADVKASAEAALAARDGLAEAKKELDAANAELAAARSGTSATVPAATATTTTVPLLPPATLSRVQQAESDFETASRAITDTTPLAQAGAQFNSAAFALEVAWLRVVVDAGCLNDDQLAQAQAKVGEYTAELQAALKAAGFYNGPVDGVYGPATVDAVKALQEKAGLAQTGLVDRATAGTLSSELAAKGGSLGAQSIASTAALQTVLTLAGYWSGPIDGQWTDALTSSLKSFQKALGVPVTGAVDAATLDALQKAIAQQQQPTTTTTQAPPASSAPTTTAG